MKAVKRLPDLQQLKKWGTLDNKAYKEITKALQSKKRFLILSNKNAGKNTVMAALVNYLHRSQKETFVYPSIEGISPKTFRTNTKIKNFKRTVKPFSSYVTAFQFSGSAYTDVTSMVEYFLKDFDIIIDLRNIEGHRTVFSIYTGKESINFRYVNPEYDLAEDYDYYAA